MKDQTKELGLLQLSERIIRAHTWSFFEDLLKRKDDFLAAIRPCNPSEGHMNGELFQMLEDACLQDPELGIINLIENRFWRLSASPEIRQDRDQHD